MMENTHEEAGRSAAPAPVAPGLHPSNGENKISGRNVNGTMVVTSAPSNEAELQLYRVMQRASLLAYYDTLLEMGGDDVQQLCDAGEEEFLEIMALVGMASKPLHVRRLQKALQEWITNPAIFQIPIIPNVCPPENPFMQCTNQRLINIPPIHHPPPILQRSSVASPETNRPMYSPSPGAPENSCGSNSSQANASPVHNPVVTNNGTHVSKPSIPPTPPITTSGQSLTSRSYSPQMPTCPTTASTSSSPSSLNCSPIQLTPTLLDVQILRLATAAERLSKHLPQLEPKPQNTKKKMCKELELVMAMPETDPRRMEEIRKYAAIYGRFDCKRKPEKPLTLHEVSVNEAAAQICRFVPALLTRRDELFPLARQVVRHSGFHYSKGQAQLSTSGRRASSEEEEGPTASKRRAQELDYGMAGSRVSPDGLSRTSLSQSWWSSRDGGELKPPDSDDADSRCSYTNSMSPPLKHDAEETARAGGVESSDAALYGRDARVQVIAARGDDIIAVANPALTLSPAMRVPRVFKRECSSPADHD